MQSFLSRSRLDRRRSVRQLSKLDALLEQAGIESAEQEALWIVQHVLRLPAHHVVTDRERLLSPAELVAAKGLVQAAGRPRALAIYFRDSGVLRAGVSREPGGAHSEAGDGAAGGVCRATNFSRTTGHSSSMSVRDPDALPWRLRGRGLVRVLIAHRSIESLTRCREAECCSP